MSKKVNGAVLLDVLGMREMPVSRHALTVSLFAGVALLVHSSVQAALIQSNPFGDISGTGVSQTTNADGGTAADWHDFNTVTEPYRGPTPTSPLQYDERWNSPVTISDVMLQEHSRDGTGTIYVTTTIGGPLTSPFATFNVNSQSYDFSGPNVPTSGIYGVRVEVNSTTTPYYQMGDIEIESQAHSANLALGATTIYTAGSLRTGSVTDQSTTIASSWRANPSATENYVGFEFPGLITQPINAIRVSSGNADSTPFAWHNFNVEVEQSNVWVDLGQVNFTDPSQTIMWVTLPTTMSVQGVRLFGSDALGNNPGAGNDLIVEDIAAFAVPEPVSAAAMMVGLAGLGLRHRRQNL